MKILFAGTPEFAIPALRAANESGEVVGALTALDAVRGRGKRIMPTPVALEAERLGIPVLKYPRLGREARNGVAALKPELLVAVAYGRIFGPKFLTLFARGGLNIHPSLLPEYRGPAPIPAAILAGETATGVTVQRLALEMDAGAILAQRTIPLDGTETTASLTETCAVIGAEMLSPVISDIDANRAEEVEQDPAAATYCPLINKTDGEIDWSLPAMRIERMIRAYNPWPTAYTWWNGSRLSILRGDAIDETDRRMESAPGTVRRVDKGGQILVQTGVGSLTVEQLQLQSKKALSIRDFLNGHPEFIGSVLGASS